MKVLPRQLKCRTMLEALGYSRSGASALTGNFCVESGPPLPTAFRSRNLDHGSNGLAQWRLERLTAYKNYVENQKAALITDDMTDAQVDKILWPWYGRMDFQTQFVARELKQDYPALHAKLVKGGDVAALTADVCWQYERPNRALSHIAERIAYAKAIALAPAPAEAAVTSAPAPVGIVDHLHAAVAKHTQRQAGDYGIAALGGLGVAGLSFSHILPHLHTWEIIAFAILAVLLLAGIGSALTEAKRAADVQAALAGVTKVPQPADVILPKAAQLEVPPAPAPAAAPAPVVVQVVAPAAPAPEAPVAPVLVGPDGHPLAPSTSVTMKIGGTA